MIALDTSVIVRVLTQDDAGQARRATAIMRSGPLFVPKTVLIEVEWVLRKAYGFAGSSINDGLRKLVGMKGLEVEDRAAIVRALAWHAGGMDFADAVHVASSSPAVAFATFDADLAKKADRVEAAPPIRLH